VTISRVALSRAAGEPPEAWAEEEAQKPEHEGDRLSLTPEDLGLRITQKIPERTVVSAADTARNPGCPSGDAQG
jgi:hypothetical protein